MHSRRKPLDPSLQQLGIIQAREREPLVARIMRLFYRTLKAW